MDERIAREARTRAGVVSLRGRRVGTRDLRRVGRRSAIAVTSPVSAEQRLWIAQLEVGEPMAFTGATAAAILGFRQVDHPAPITAMVPTGRRVRPVPGVSLTRAAPSDLTGIRVVGGHPVTSIEVTVRELARVVRTSRLVGVVQDQLRLRTTTESRLRAATGRGRAGSARLREALDVCGDGAHSRAERALSAALRRAGASGFRCQVAVTSAAHQRYWLDVLFDDARVGVEVMGPHHLEPEQFDYDCRRANAILGEHGIRLLRYPASRVAQNAASVAAEIVSVVSRP